MKEKMYLLKDVLNKLANGAGGASAGKDPTNGIGTGNAAESVNITWLDKVGMFFSKMFSNILTAIFNLFNTLIITICRFILNIIDFLTLAVRELAGQNVVADIASKKSLADSDMVFRFLMNDTIRRVFRAFLGIGLVLVIVFAIVALIRKEYENFLSGDSKSNNRKVIVRMLTSLFLIILVPIVTFGGIILSNSLLSSIPSLLASYIQLYKLDS